MNIVKKFLPLIAVAVLSLYPNQSSAQSYEDWYNIGAAIGSAARRGVDRARERREEEARRQQEEARRQQEEAERERQYQLERQRVENERIMAEQKAAEERRLEQERIRQAEEAKRAEEERIREARRIEEEKQRRAESEIEKKAAEEELDLYNTSAHILSPRNEAIFRTSDGHELILLIQSDKLLYKNRSEKEELVICNNATIKIKYANEPNEETLNDACQIKLNPTGSNYGEIPLSDVFFNISSHKEIEFVKIRLSDTKIRSGKRIQKAIDLEDELKMQNATILELDEPLVKKSETTLNNKTFTDLGLPSKTLWRNDNEQGFYTYDEAVNKFGNKLPTKEQYIELKQYCSWSWTGSGYKVTGPNGNSITLPAAGYRDCEGSVNGVGSYGYYLSTTPNGSDSAWYLLFYSSRVDVSYSLRCFGRPVRLVQDK